MFTIKNYVMAKSLEEAYQLNQKKGSTILGGTMWLKMGRRSIQNAIDLSELGLDRIEENEEAFEIGCMATLRDLELDSRLNSYFDGAVAEAVRRIVGVQFRNCATIGGSIYGRYGFSDPLTCLLVLDTWVELYEKGRIPLSEFVNMPYDRDILVKIIIKKDDRKVFYQSYRRTETDFPVVACAVARSGAGWLAAIGARPGRAKQIADDGKILGRIPTDEEIAGFISYVEDNTVFKSNMRGSGEYRRHLAGVLLRRGIEEVSGREG